VKISLLQCVVTVWIFIIPSFFVIKFFLRFRDGENRNFNFHLRRRSLDRWDFAYIRENVVRMVPSLFLHSLNLYFLCFILNVVLDNFDKIKEAVWLPFDPFVFVVPHVVWLMILWATNEAMCKIDNILFIWATSLKYSELFHCELEATNKGYGESIKHYLILLLFTYIKLNFTNIYNL
jgi:hypothetical protein